LIEAGPLLDSCAALVQEPVRLHHHIPFFVGGFGTKMRFFAPLLAVRGGRGVSSSRRGVGGGGGATKSSLKRPISFILRGLLKETLLRSRMPHGFPLQGRANR
jgi:hypothetical protein